MLGRDGRISVVRVGVLAGLIGILVIVGGVATFYLDRVQHQQPLVIEPYPGAASWGVQQTSSSTSMEYYLVEGASPEQVDAYYQQQMDSFYGSNTEPEFKNCKRTPSNGNFAAFDRREPNAVAYEFNCLFDDSGFFITRHT
ncbi:MAG: hypothetical protein K8I60_03495, partial [Anaerolineae bacterium]|nr:hypothetical protein [Anaerolineae bacterium]